MTIHRPHPITGPWPHHNRTTEPGRGHVPGHYRRAGTIPLIDQEPTDDALIYDDPEDAVLWDGCDRCAQHADHPLTSLDPDRLGRLWVRMVEVERDTTYRAHYTTGTEARAAQVCYRIAVMVERTHPAINPWTWPWHLRAGNVSFALDGRVGLDVAGITMGDQAAPLREVDG